MCLAVPGKLTSMDGDEPMFRTGIVDFGGVRREVSLACVPEAELGDYVLVHVGLAISVIDEAEARRVFEYLAEMDELGELQP
ncbi:HypC/HybG/HupF family hydrogenase formation chaperone [Ectothiorhodospiraceae bacterium WFHF3C12]|nr:HypC/HybG/HupF family hydrogenase formation chaperone [Ectothiorhodospiraceae bacterium WFHF3C12]